MMKKSLILWVLLIGTISVWAAEREVIRIGTDATDLVLEVASNGRLYQTWLGPKLLHEADIRNFRAPGQKWEAYPASGMEDYFEPALGVIHNDGNQTTLLKFVSVSQRKVDGNVMETEIRLKDEVYPVEVTLFYTTYARENIIKSWTEIRHKEKKPVTLFRYASSMLYWEASDYYLTEFSGDWAREVNISTQELQFGKKVIDTKLGSRSAMFVSPFFQIGFGAPAAEDQGNVLVGTIGWTGNFGFTFEVDNFHHLRVISGINPYASDYSLKPGEVFKTPEFVFTYSENGTGQASRNFHDWARRYQVKDGMGKRMTLLNNWESTAFKFDEAQLFGLMKEAKDLGVDLFLLDDGWFANKYPRNNDKTGLGDWEPMKSKLPNGVGPLVAEAEKTGVKFGIWIEPEMVSPKSELFEKHPEWAIHSPNREPYYYRNQLVLDLSNPAVQDFVFGVVDNLMKENPGIAYFKWDCNSPITNIYSPYLKEKQSQLYVDHVRGIYKVLERVKARYPNLPMMLCSGGGGRCDYEALKYFTEFWPSDNTDAVERIFIQWGFSQLFPSRTMCAHVTSWGRQPVKFRTDVAMMCKLGYDIRLSDMNAADLEFSREAVKNFKRLEEVILGGDLYRLVSPYEGNHAAVMYTSQDQSKAVVYGYDIYPRYGEKLYKAKLKGLDPAKMYKLEEINLMPGKKSAFREHGQVLSGDYLMKAGISLFTTGKTASRVIELTVQ